MSKRIGRFEIMGEISHSVVGCVYKANDAETGQTLALKAVKLEGITAQSKPLAQLVVEEAESTKTLNSHNLALLYGAGEIEGRFCGTMEYVQGNSIATMLGRGEIFSVWDLQDIARQTCQGLDHAHARKVVHFSLEPSKLMVQWDGTVKILGFGISQLSLHPTLLAEKSAVLHYMSPEQARGEAMDARSNLFSMGAILYEMATGCKPFDGEDGERVKQQILEANPPPPDQINKKIHPALSAVIMKALAKSPEDRYASGQELAKAIEENRGNPAEAPGKLPSRATAAPGKVEPPRVGSAPRLADQLMSFSDSVHAPSPTTAAAPAMARAKISTPMAESGNAGAAAAPRMALATQKPIEAPAREENPQAAKGKSFSEISELPPLKEVYVEPAAPVETADPLQELREPHYHGPQRPVETKTPPAEVARKAVEEIRKTPPQLFLYSIGAALAIILAVMAFIAFRVHSENAQDAGSPRPAEPASEPGRGASSAAQAAPESHFPSAKQKDDDSTFISIKPKAVPRKTSKPAPPVAVQVPGQLIVNSTPAGAHVLIDGQGDPGWTTPYNVTGLAPGSHTVTLSKDGYAPETRTIQIASHSRALVSVSLAQLTANILVMGDPPGAEIFVDGHDTGRVTPSQIAMNQQGSHTVLVRKPGYLDESTTATLQFGQVFRYVPTLRRLGVTDDIRTASKLKFFGGKPEGTGAVSVKTEPKGAQISINGRILEKNSPTEFYLNPGTYVIDITLTGYKSVQRVINVEKGGKMTVDETLDRQ
jgi:eukaryotic-like serine/threonine-protein kinase